MIFAPFPYVADHVVQAIAIGLIAMHWSRSEIAVCCSVDRRKLSLPNVAAMLIVRDQVVAPGIKRLLQTATGGELPFGLGWQPCAGPVAIRLGIAPGDMH